jgi:hypothetical protein
MSAGLLRRLAAIEQRQRDSLPQLPALVVIGENNLEAERAEFIATHGRPPELELVIKIAPA